MSSSAQNSSIDFPQARRKRVVVCGGGVIGVCSAYFLAKKGAAVTLIEKCSIACAASGKAAGFLALDWCDDTPHTSLARTSFNLHRSLAQQLDGAQSYGYRSLTTLSLVLNEFNRESKHNSSPIPSWIDGPASCCRELGSTETTAQVHPRLFTRTLMAKAVADYGVEIVIGTVENVSVDEEEKATGVEMEGGRRIEGDAVVLALGPWSGRLTILSSIFRVRGIKAHSVVVEPKDSESISPHALFLCYFCSEGGLPLDPEIYPRPTGEVYICGMCSQVAVPDGPEQVTGDPESIAMLKRVASTVSSRLGEGEGAVVKAEQACFLPITDDAIPVIGEVPGVNGCYVATGHSCWGILNGPATGAAMAELVVDGQASIVDLSPFSPARFIGGRRR